MIGRTMICCANGIGEMTGSGSGVDDPRLMKAAGGKPLLLFEILALLPLCKEEASLVFTILGLILMGVEFGRLMSKLPIKNKFFIFVSILCCARKVLAVWN